MSLSMHAACKRVDEANGFVHDTKYNQSSHIFTPDVLTPEWYGFTIGIDKS